MTPEEEKGFFDKLKDTASEKLEQLKESPSILLLNKSVKSRG